MEKELIKLLASEIISGGDTLDNYDLLEITKEYGIDRVSLKNGVEEYIKSTWPSKDKNLGFIIWDEPFLKTSFNYWFPEITD